MLDSVSGAFCFLLKFSIFSRQWQRNVSVSANWILIFVRKLFCFFISLTKNYYFYLFLDESVWNCFEMFGFLVFAFERFEHKRRLSLTVSAKLKFVVSEISWLRLKWLRLDIIFSFHFSFRRSLSSSSLLVAAPIAAVAAVSSSSSSSSSLFTFKHALPLLRLLRWSLTVKMTFQLTGRLSA